MNTSFKLTCTPVTTNSDITGIGNRTSIYAQGLLGVIITTIALINPKIGTEKVLDLLRTSIVTAFSLILAAIIQFKSSAGLSPVDQLVVINLSFVQMLVAAAIAPLIFTFSLSLRFVYFLFAIFYSAFGLLVWSDKNNVLPPPGGCLTIYVLFGRNVHADSVRLRHGLLFCFVATLFFAMVLLRLVVLAVWHRPGPQADKTDKNPESVESGLVRKGVYWAGVAIALASWIINVVQTEQMVSRNGISAQTRVWSFGQTLSLILLLLQLIDIFTIIHRILHHETLQENGSNEHYQGTA